MIKYLSIIFFFFSINTSLANNKENIINNSGQKLVKFEFKGEKYYKRRHSI